MNTNIVPTRERQNLTMSFSVKIAIVGEKGTGKMSIATKYVEDHFDVRNLSIDNTLPYGCLYKTVPLLRSRVTLSIWYLKMSNIDDDESLNTHLSRIIEEARVVLFTFDLTSMESLLSIKQWYKTCDPINKVE